MIIKRILKLGYSKLLSPSLLTHTATCPTKYEATPSGDDNSEKCAPGPKRAMRSGKVRMGLIPEEWFLFFHSKTGVSGPYLLGLGTINYLLSKEIYVLEHEYYVGLSTFIMVYYATTRFGPELAKMLDREVDAHVKALEETRQEERNYYLQIVKDAKDAQWRAEGQKLLMDAKKENIAMQLEATYRQRLMEFHRTVKRRLDYHVKSQQSFDRIQQKWIIQYIIENVKKDIQDPEFQEDYFNKTIEEITAMADLASK